MKTKLKIRAAALPALWLVSLAGAAMVTGCSDVGPVRERTVIHERDGVRPGVYRTRTVRRIEPVGESYIVRPWNRRVVITAPGDRYYNPPTRNWERPWPYGPYDSGNYSFGD